MTDPDLSAMTEAVNATLVERGYKFGPVRIRAMDAMLPQRDRTLCMTDANGRRSILDDDIEVDRAVVALHNRHMHRIALDNETARARDFMESAFEGLTRGRIDVALQDALDGRRDSFMVFQADLDLLSDSLAWRRARIDYRPYSRHGTDVRKVILAQRRRLALLKAQDGDRKGALRCCPVLARKMTDRSAGAACKVMFDMALEDMAGGDSPHFEEGRIIGEVDLGDDTVWSNARVKLGRQLPDTVLAMLKGRPLSDVVTHPFLPDGLVITSASQKGRRTMISTDAGKKDVPLKGVLERMPGGRLGRKLQMRV